VIRSTPGTPLRERLERLIEPEPTSGCWLWIGARDVKGYGAFTAEGVHRGAHRVVYEVFTGERIPDGLTLDHLCRTPCCVNPAHLQIVTMRENTLRGTGLPAQYAKRTSCPQGHPYDDSNTRRWGGHRLCRECGRSWMRSYSKRRHQNGWTRQRDEVFKAWEREYNQAYRLGLPRPSLSNFHLRRLDTPPVTMR
jgi:hypothetical protein